MSEVPAIHVTGDDGLDVLYVAVVKGEDGTLTVQVDTTTPTRINVDGVGYVWSNVVSTAYLQDYPPGGMTCTNSADHVS